MSHPVLIEAEHVTKDYVIGRGQVVHALRGVDFAVRRGEMVAVVGPSGSGKSTLLHLLGLLDRPSAGRIRLADQWTDALHARELPAVRNHKLGFVFQRHYLIPTLTVLDNVRLPLRYRRPAPSREEADQEARRWLQRVELSHRMHHRPTELSGGERQRTAIARALITQPALLLGDEPTGELDSVTGGRIVDLLRRLNRADGQTIVLVTHDHAVAQQCDRIVRMRDGCIEDA